MANLKKSKVFATSITAAVAASALVPAASFAATNFNDVQEGSYYADAVNYLASEGHINGYGDGSFLPSNEVTRAEAAKVITSVQGLIASGTESYSDVSSSDWFYDAVRAASNAGIFQGYNGEFNPAAQLTRQEAAKIIVESFDLEGEGSTTFTDINGAWGESYIETAFNAGVINGITTTTFAPDADVTRADFAVMIHRAIEAAGMAENPAVEGVKATNSTTVEVDFVEEITDVEAYAFSIEGLDVTNAAVKQTDSSVVVLTTTTQDGGAEYAVVSNDEVLGSFTGLSSVVPTEITLEEDAVQGIVGQNVSLKADIGVKEAGVAVTFNVDNTDDIGKDYVKEVLTDANGIATYSYTQYVAGAFDSVAVYPTGAPATRDVAQVTWGVDTILEITAVDSKEGNALANGDSKQYKVTYKDPETGKPVSGARIDLSFLENINVNPDELTTATINGVNPTQLANGTTPVTSEVVTNSKGEATFSVSGTNTAATPVAFVDNNINNKLDERELKVSADKVTFGAEQATHVIEITSETAQEAATGLTNGRTFEVIVKDKDGKVAAGETVNIAFNEDIDRNISTNTEADLIVPGSDPRVKDGDKQISVKLDKDGKGEFTVVSNVVNDYATPVAWIDINSSNAKEGNLDDGEASVLAEKTYFAAEKVADGLLKVTDPANDEDQFAGTEAAVFSFTAANQSGKAYSGNIGIKATYTVFNTGTTDVIVDGTTISPNRSASITRNTNTGSANSITVETVGDESGSVRVEATATTNDTDATYLGKHSETAKFLSTDEIADFYTGTISRIDTVNEKIYFVGKSDGVSYDGAKFTAVNGSSVTEQAFEELFLTGEYSATYEKDSDGKVTFDLISKVSSTPTTGANNVSGSVAFNAATYTSADTATITVTDADLNTDSAAIETYSASALGVTVADTDKDTANVDLSSVVFTETTADSGIFTSGNVTLTTLAGGTITVTYQDAANASGATVTVNDTATYTK